MRDKISEVKKTFNWQLWGALCASALIPAAYQTVKTFLISTSGQNEVFNIIGQMEWFDLINETLLAFLIVPLYSVLNKVFKAQRASFAEVTFKTGLAAFAAYGLFSACVLIYGETLIQAMNPDNIDLSAVSGYLRLETFSFMIAIVVSFVNVVFVVVGSKKNIWIFLGVKTALSLFSDLLLIPRFALCGAAVSNIIVNAPLALVGLFILHRRGLIRFGWPKKSDANIFRQWCGVGAFSGLQQFVDNFVYAVMVCKMVNMISQQGVYWNANNFIWGWLLIPISALGEVIRSDCKDGYDKLKPFNYYFIAGVTAAFWAVSVPLWTPFYRCAEHLPNAGEVFGVTLKLAPFYIFYAGSAVIDNIFIGMGKTAYTFVNSLIVNLVYYGAFYLLYLAKPMIFDMNVIILMFGFGMALHLIISVIEEWAFRKARP